ncbi:MAG: SDR family NAD(P)-dependent oxidoreductase [Candidatus Eisenbacteria bacterium]|uniref:SDR family NAD(P)-dependent oxidoreductase n=1 Tax=Eiseniibacteriota bacterium TaxID=2212470 RepID=A0A937X8K8_UNCEI|nr:SDR family NAD(P)-dependent oxidoreductase [Candidatus Eisenbacteria bacterium]
MRVLVTGGAGFIGSHLVEALLARGDSVAVLDDLSTGRAENLAAVLDHPRLAFLRADVRDTARCAACVEEADALFHLAAHVGVRRILAHTLESLLNNVQATAALLEQAARRKRRVILFSSSEVYGKGRGGVLEESDDLVLGAPGVARWSYGTGKALDETLALAWHRERGLPVTVVRCFNTCGPRQTDRYGMVLPTFIRQALGGSPLTVFGDGGQTRCFSHVGDVVRGTLMLLAAPGSIGEVFNVGNDEEIAIGALAERIVALTGSRSPIVRVPYAHALGGGFEDVRRRVPSLAKIRAFVGYEPRVGLEELLRLTIAAARAEGDEREPRTPGAALPAGGRAP